MPLQNHNLKSVHPARRSAWFLRRIMEVLDSVDTEHDMSAETRARIFEPFYTPKQTPECSHVISKIIFSRAQRNRALRQCDQSTSAKVQLLPFSRIRALRFSRIASTLDAAADAPS